MKLLDLCYSLYIGFIAFNINQKIKKFFFHNEKLYIIQETATLKLKYIEIS